jgi:hypothetical protein
MGMQLKTKILVTGLTGAVVAIGILVTLLASEAIISSKTIASSRIIATANIGFYSDSVAPKALPRLTGVPFLPVVLLPEQSILKT